MIKFATIAAAALTLTVAPATAKDGSWQVGNDQIHIVYSDINTNTTAGRAVLLARVERAAAKLCAETIGTDRPACVRSVMSAAAVGAKGQSLAIAMTERNGTAVAVR